MTEWGRFLMPLRPLVPFFVTAVALVILLWSMNWVLLGRRRQLRKDERASRQLAMLALTVAGIFALLFALPVERTDRDQLIGVVGLVVSALVAYSSSAALGDVVAGLALRARSPFSIGDHVRIGEHVGRVVDVGLLDVEIQSRDRELISLPNGFVATNPIVKTRSSGAIISATVSLGYDTHHAVIETLLRDAASSSGFDDAFVSVLELGDFSVTYRVAGLLTDVDSLITARSNLQRAMLDTLHENDIEIMSPTFVRKQIWPPDERLIPTPVQEPSEVTETTQVEDVVFDKAARAVEIEAEKSRLSAELGDLKERLGEASEEQQAAIQERVEGDQKRLEALEEESVTLATEDEDGD